MAQSPVYPSALVSRHDETVARYLQNQVTTPASRWRGAMPDTTGIYFPATAVGMMEVFTAAYCCRESRFYQDAEVLRRLALAAGFVERILSPDGNIYLPTTNFNSPPDTGFAVRSAAVTALLARRERAAAISALIDPLVQRMARAIRDGGIHTPNHRWVVCAALAQVNELWPDTAWIRRINQWLAEGPDIDSDGQWSERSTVTYNPICDAAFVVMAEKLGRAELLDPVRRNLESMLYLLHADGEVETGFSRRQDLNVRGTMAGYWFPLQYFAAKLGDRRFGELARQHFDAAASLATLMAYPELNRTDYAADPVPATYVREFTHNGLVRFRDGLASVTLSTAPRDRFLSFRYGGVVVNAVRFASAFFGKGQFIPERAEKLGPRRWRLTQSLAGPYYQPLTPSRAVDGDRWAESRLQRVQTEVCRLTQSATVSCDPQGIRLEVRAEGTADVPVAVEISLREGVEAEGVSGSLWSAAAGRLHHRSAQGSTVIEIEGGGVEHRYTDIRGALPRLPGTSIYVTGLTPFRREFRFRWPRSA